MNKKNLIFVTLLISVVLVMSFISAGWFSGKVVNSVESVNCDDGNTCIDCDGHSGSVVTVNDGVGGTYDQCQSTVGDTTTYTSCGFKCSFTDTPEAPLAVRAGEFVDNSISVSDIGTDTVDIVDGNGVVNTYTLGSKIESSGVTYRVEKIKNSLFKRASVSLVPVEATTPGKEETKACPGQEVTIKEGVTSSVNGFLTGIVSLTSEKAVLGVEGGQTLGLSVGEQIYSLKGNGLFAYLWSIRSATLEGQSGEVDICLTKEETSVPSPTPEGVRELGNYELIQKTFEIPVSSAGIPGVAEGTIDCGAELGPDGVVLGGGYVVKNAVETGVMVNAPTTSTTYDVSLNVDTSAGTGQSPTLIVYATCARKFIDTDSDHKSLD